MSPSEFQEALARLAIEIGEETLRLYLWNYPEEWRDEEGVTGALLGAVAFSASSKAGLLQVQGGPRVNLKATLAKKLEENRHGADAIIRFNCRHDLWSISTSTLIQAKIHDRGRNFDSDGHERLKQQLDKMMQYTPENFVMLYTLEEGIQLIPGLAARSLGSRDLFDAKTLPWPRFLSGIFLGRFGEPLADRSPYAPAERQPVWVLNIDIEATPAARSTAAVAAAP